MSTPYVFVARRAGYRELANFDKLGIEYPYTSVNVLRETLTKNPDLVDKFLRCIVEGIYIFKTNKPRTLAVLKQYMKGASNEIIDDTYQYAAAALDETPRPSLQVVKTALDMLSLQYPQAKQTDASLIIDASFMNRIEQSGFIRSLYKK
jgi:ABC-type nitrate/sulfonate/bicarbonate transport system substrate-binding protein